MDLLAARQAAGRRHDFLEMLGEQTGGRPIVDTDDLEGAIAGIFQEYGSYYLIGYETENGEPDGKFRRLAVEVRGRDVDVRAKSGWWAPDKDSLVAQGGPGACLLDCWHVPPPASHLQLAGLMPQQPLKVRAAAYPTGFAPSFPGGPANEIEVATVLTVRIPAVLRAVEEKVTVVRTVYAANGRGAPPIQETFLRPVVPAAGGETQYDLPQRFSLPAGRHQVRFNASSRVADASGTVIVTVEVPDLSRPGATASPIVIGTLPEVSGDQPFGGMLPIVPTTSRDFSRADRIVAFLRFFAGGTQPASQVQVSARILGADDAEAVEIPASTIPREAFAGDRTAQYLTELPLARLPSGLHLLTISATSEDARVIRRDLVFRVR
jgi:hypothetical protein